METSESIDQIMAALCKAQASMGNAAKDKQNPHFKSSYADLASVREASKDALTSNGLVLTQGIGYASGEVVVTTILGHVSGQWLKSRLNIPIQKVDAQGIGSASTYGRRFSWAAMVGVAPEDDDGNEASKAPSKAKQAATTLDDVRAKHATETRSVGNVAAAIAAPMEEARRNAGAPTLLEQQLQDRLAELDNVTDGDGLLSWVDTRAVWYWDMPRGGDRDAVSKAIGAACTRTNTPPDAVKMRIAELASKPESGALRRTHGQLEKKEGK